MKPLLYSSLLALCYSTFLYAENPCTKRLFLRACHLNIAEEKIDTTRGNAPSRCKATFLWLTPAYLSLSTNCYLCVNDTKLINKLLQKRSYSKICGRLHHLQQELLP
ncbi:MAG: hypothetical protein AAF518_05025 [Spirochaetota bacterium]